MSFWPLFPVLPLGRYVNFHMCDGLRVPAIFPARLLGNGRQAQQGLDTNVMLPTTWLNALQMAAPGAAI